MRDIPLPAFFGPWLRSLAAALPALALCECALLTGDTPSPPSASTATPSSDGDAGSVAKGSLDGGPAPRDARAPSADGGSSAPPMRGPAPPTANARFPFPQNRQSGRCIYPTNYLNSDVLAAYARWKQDTVTSDGAGGHLRVKRTSSDSVDLCRPGGSTVSEGVAYGMLIAVYMNDQALFDGLWLYEQQNLDGNGLMNWAPEGAADGGGASCTGGATDADEDMAFALAMADRQWGGQGTLAKVYKQLAVDQIGKIWMNEVFQYKWIRSGDGNWATNSNVNISYFAPAYYRVFRAVDPDPSHDWNAVAAQVYVTIGDALNGNGNQNSGLVPAWCDDSSLSTCRPGTPGHYQYDSCRTPFRIGLDWCWNGQVNGQAYVQKTSSFFSGIGVSNIADGYGLDGTPRPEHPGKLSAAFIGPAAIGAMNSNAYQGFLDQAYDAVSRLDLLAGGAYYEDSWTVMSLLMMTGNFLDYTAY